MDWPTAALWSTGLTGAFLPLLAVRWLHLIALVVLSGLGILLGSFLCISYGNHPGMAGLICYLVPMLALTVGAGSAVIAACRCYGRTRDWQWGQFPGLLLPAALAYGLPLVAWALLVD